MGCTDVGTTKADNAIFWPWLEPFLRGKSMKPFTMSPSRSTAATPILSSSLQSPGSRVSILEQLFRRNVKGFRGGLVFKAHRLLYHSTLCSETIQNKKGRNRLSGAGRDTSREVVPDPFSSEYGIYKTVNARSWSLLQGLSR